MTALREGVVRLADGRVLGYAEYGRRGAQPVLLFHGVPGGRAFDLGDAVREAGVWLFVLERPGFGLSDSQPRRRLLDWPADVAEFADAVGIDRFAVVGFSAGAPYALACGHALDDRVALVGSVVGFVPFAAEPELDALLDSEWCQRRERCRADCHAFAEALHHDAAERHRRWADDPMAFYRQTFGPAADVLPEYWVRIMGATYGGEPDVDEELVELSPWGFDVGEIRCPVRAWHGGADPDAPLGLVEELIRRISDGSLRVYPGEGHFIDPSHRSEFLPALAAW